MDLPAWLVGQSVSYLTSPVWKTSGYLLSSPYLNPNTVLWSSI